MVDRKELVGALFPATEQGNIEDVIVFIDVLKKGGMTQFNFTDEAGYTLLHVAAIEGHLALVQYFLTLNLNPNQSNAQGMTPFLHACQRGKSKVVIWMLGHVYDRGTERNEKVSEGLFCAISCGQLNTVKHIIGFAEKKNIPVLEEVNEAGRNALAIALQSKNWEIAEYLIDKKKMNLFKKNTEGHTALDEVLEINALDEMNFHLPKYKEAIDAFLKKNALSGEKKTSYDVHRDQEQTKADKERYERLERLTRPSDKRRHKNDTRNSLFNKRTGEKLDRAKELIDEETKERFPQLEKFYKKTD